MNASNWRRRALQMVLAAVALAPAGAAAYPQWQFTSGATRCNQCHYGPGGGGLINTYARDAVGEELSTFDGDGAFLHGKVDLPPRLSLGGDFRGAFVSHSVNEPTGPHNAVFPMQADIQARVVVWEGVSVAATGGVRGQQRSGQDIIPYQNYQPIYTSRLVSREHYVMWQPGALGAYVRAGRFFAPFGLRLAEHVTYVRRDLGFNQLQETYNLSAGYVTNLWELHLTAFAPDFVREIGSSQSGAAVYVERRVLNEKGAIAAQTVYSTGSGASRVVGGTVAKYYASAVRTLFLAEGNLVHWSLDGDFGRNQFVGAGGVALLPTRGLMVTLLGERNQEDLAVRATAWNAGTALINWFPYPHVELQVMGRMQFPGGATPAKTLFVQLHYFL